VDKPGTSSLLPPGFRPLSPFPQDGFTLADPDEEMSARHLCHRLVALKRALDDIPGHAKRLGRLEARRKAGLPHARRHAPLRPGWPPGRPQASRP
jgi:hypothetical protein